jgi:hypothetical protein
MVDSAASDNERKLGVTLTELEKAEAALAEAERICKAPRGKYVPATPSEIAEAQKASIAASPKRRAEQNRENKVKRTRVRRGNTEYRNYVIYFQRKPGPSFGDWNFHHNDYDGAPESAVSSCSDHRCGYAETPKEARAEIDAQYVDFELDENGHYTRRGKIMQAGTHE